jgi:hypothetical protein
MPLNLFIASLLLLQFPSHPEPTQIVGVTAPPDSISTTTPLCRRSRRSMSTAGVPRRRSTRAWRSVPTSAYARTPEGSSSCHSTSSCRRRRASSAVSVWFCDGGGYMGCGGSAMSSCWSWEDGRGGDTGVAMDELDSVGFGVAMPICLKRAEKAGSAIGSIESARMPVRWGLVSV